MANPDSELDLNLLRYLVALVEERSVSRTADRLGVTQPAVSAALKRLRDRFRDPIVVRAGQVMSPTPHPLELAQQIAPMLVAVRELARGRGAFDPVRAPCGFTLMGSDYVQFFLLPRLCARLDATGARVTLDHRPANPSRIESWMESGQVDLGIGYLLTPPPALRHRLLFTDQQVCVLRKGHPATRRPFTAEQYAEFAHVVISPGGAGIYRQRTDEVLKAQGIRRRVALTLPSFLAVPYVVARTDYVATVPARFAKYFVDLLPLQAVPVPIPLPAFELSMFWHERVQHDRANAWLRQQVVAVSAELV